MRAAARLRRALVEAALVAAAPFACATVEMPRPTPADASRAAATWPGASLSELERGRALYLARCTGCHQPIALHEVTKANWPRQIIEMRERAKLTDSEVEILTRYVVVMADQPPVAAAAK